MCKCHRLKEESKTGSENLTGNRKKVTLNKKKKSSKQVSSVQRVKKILSSPAARLFGRNKMQSIFHLAPKETKHSQIDPFLCDKHNHKTFPHPRGSAAFILKVWKKKKSFTVHLALSSSSFFLIFTLEPIRCISGVLVSFTTEESIYLHFHSILQYGNISETRIFFRECDPVIVLSSRLFFYFIEKKSHKKTN